MSFSIFARCDARSAAVLLMAMGNQLTKIEDIAPIVEFLVDKGWWITGQTIFANGGYTTR